jgi:hypothetical protein
MMAGDVSADVVEWSPEPASADELERRRLVVEALGECDRRRVARAERLAAVNVALARAGQLPASADELAELEYDRAVAGECRPALLATTSTAAAEPWEVVERPPVEPERADPRAELARIVETHVHQHWAYWGRIGRRYPLPAAASADEHSQAIDDRRVLLDVVNRELVADGRGAIGDGDLVVAMARMNRTMVPDSPPGFQRDQNGRFSRRRMGDRSSATGRR